MSTGNINIPDPKPRPRPSPRTNMSTGKEEDGKKPSLSQYFAQTSSTSPAASFFDQISSGNGPAMMTSVRESASSQDLFQAATHTVHSTFDPNESKRLPATMENVSEISTRAPDSLKIQSTLYDSNTKTPTKEEPVVCRIFSSQDIGLPSDDSKVAPGKIFFDMLGTGGGQTPNQTGMLGVDLLIPSMPTSGGSSMVTSPDFTTTDSFITPSATPTPTGDTFASILPEEHESFTKVNNANPSEADRRRDAWIPSAKTRQALITAVTSPPGTYFPERDLMTMPGVVLEEDLADVVHEVVSHYLGEAEASKRKVLTVNDVTQDERGLRELIQAGCFRAAVNLTGRLLTMYGQGSGRSGHPSKHTVHSIQLWFTRLALLVKLRSFTLADVESEPFVDLDQPDLYFQFYQDLYGGRMGSMVPFAFRLLVAELPQYVNKHQEALNRLHRLLATVRRILQNLESGLCEDGSPAEISAIDREDSKKLWASREARVLHSIVNTALYQKDYCLAIEVLELLISSRDWGNHQKRALLSALGRVYLQLGDVAGAEKSFGSARELRQQQNGGSVLSGSSSDLRDLIDRGLMAVAQNAFQEAYDCFNKASALDPANIMLFNNMGVCLLYLGRLKEALSLLEGAVNNNPTWGLHENLLLNVCTLYELESSLSNQKKQNMLRLLSRYKGDGICVGCLKLAVAI